MLTGLHSGSISSNVPQTTVSTSTSGKRKAISEIGSCPGKRATRSQNSACGTRALIADVADQLYGGGGERGALHVHEGEEEKTTRPRTRPKARTRRTTADSPEATKCQGSTAISESEELDTVLTRELVNASRKAWSTVSVCQSSPPMATFEMDEDLTRVEAISYETSRNNSVPRDLPILLPVDEHAHDAVREDFEILEMEELEHLAFTTKRQTFLAETLRPSSTEKDTETDEVSCGERGELSAEFCMFEIARTALKRKWLLRRVAAVNRVKESCIVVEAGGVQRGLGCRRRSLRLPLNSACGGTVDMGLSEEVQRWQYGQLGIMDARIGAWLGLRQALSRNARPG